MAHLTRIVILTLLAAYPFSLELFAQVPVAQPGTQVQQPSAAPPPVVNPKNPSDTAGKQQVAGNADGNSKTTAAPISFNEAIATVTSPSDPEYPPLPTFVTTTCKSDHLIRVTVDLKGSASQARLGNSGIYCFSLYDINLILYDYTFTGNIPSVQQTPLDLLKDAISTASGLFSGTPTKSTTPEPAAPCPVSTDDAGTAAARFDQAIAAMDPGKDSSGKVNGGVPYATSKAAFDKSVTPNFRAFETTVGTLIAGMKENAGAPQCSAVFSKAETIVSSYIDARSQYLALASREIAPQTVELEEHLEDYEPFVLTANESASGAATNFQTETFNFDPLFSLVTSSVGFMVTELPSRSYTSATAPSTSGTSSTENVLVVNGMKGPRATIDALLNVNVPGFNGRNIGLGVTVGPVFDITNGKANTSNFGLFGGISLRLTDYLYVTPGFHLGQFADFPQGYSAVGQVIPPNTGTPTAVNRYTARFGVSFSFKVKDLYSPKAASSASKPSTTTTSKPSKPTTSTKPSKTAPKPISGD
jgi:hypothetical protein